MSDGIYVLANDRVFEWTAAALVNLRRTSPLPVTVIPFDDAFERTRRLAGTVGASVLDVPAAVDRATVEAARLLWPGNAMVARLLRKIAVFSGPYDRFVFADVDQLFTQDVPSLMVRSLREDGDLDVVAGWCDPGQTWAATAEGYASPSGWSDADLSMNTGLWASRAGLLTPEQLVEAAADVARDRLSASFAHVGDQPLLNVALAGRGVRHATLAELHPSLPTTSTWSGHHPWWLRRRPRPVAMHWAGLAHPSPTMPASNLYLRWRLQAPGRVRGLVLSGARAVVRPR